MPVSSKDFIDQPESAVQAQPSASAQPSSNGNGGNGQTGSNHWNPHGKASSSRHHKNKYNYSSSQPTNSVVLKNLDYNISQATLEEVVRRVTEGRNEFVSISLIDDKQTGTFRGVAFVNFNTVADATAALGELSKMVINKRKVVAEYRRPRPGEREKKDYFEKRPNKKFEHFGNNYNRSAHDKDTTAETDGLGNSIDKRAAFFAKRGSAKKGDEQKRHEERSERDKEKEAEFRKRLVDYSNLAGEDGDIVDDLVFEASLTSYERRMVHDICNGLGLGHISLANEDGVRVLHVTKDPIRKEEWDKETAKIKANQKKEDAHKRKNRENGDSRTPAEWKKNDSSKDNVQGIKWFKPRAAQGTQSDKDHEAMGVGGIRAPTYKLYVPPRQPIGPDGTVGFTARVGKAAEKPNETSPENGRIVGDSMLGEARDIDEGATAEQNGVTEADGHDEKEAETIGGKGSTHTVLNPSVPAFSPSFSQTY
eukprot:GFKZ01003135.1.p1 GENE.GFKZ01003135.1~~GFKZ01003135.1.p1  ORF type:complete len:479 (+),score=96.20 GFKZ01003135.1:343-1779(+)